jgi:hypothetical protein
MSFLLYKTLMDTSYAPSAAKSLDQAMQAGRSSGRPTIQFNYPIGNTSEHDFSRINLADAMSRVAAAGARISRVDPVPSEVMPGYVDFARLTISFAPPQAPAAPSYGGYGAPASYPPATVSAPPPSAREPYGAGAAPSSYDPYGAIGNFPPPPFTGGSYSIPPPAGNFPSHVRFEQPAQMARRGPPPPPGYTGATSL